VELINTIQGDDVLVFQVQEYKLDASKVGTILKQLRLLAVKSVRNPAG
jgi:hypothetical protein